MEISLISEIVTSVGVPVAVCVVFIWIVLDVYKLSKTKVIAHLEKQSAILEKQTATVEAISHAIEISTGVLDKICTVALNTQALVERLTDGNGGKKK